MALYELHHTKADKQNKLLADINIIQLKGICQIMWLFNVLHWEM